MDPENPTRVLFAEKGLCATRQRTAIYEALLATKNTPPSTSTFTSAALRPAAS